jgi:hypothetical protein
LLRREDLTGNEPDGRYRELPIPRLTVLRSGDLAYTRSIRHGLLTRLEQALGRSVQLNEKSGLTEATCHADWQEQVNSLLDTTRSIGGCDYYVPIGTQAAQALHLALGDKYGTTPFVFLGVTYPKEAGLLHTATGGSEPWSVTGVNYGKGVEEIAVILYYRIFQKQRELIFIHQNDIPQDVIAGQKLRETPLFQSGRLSVRSVDAVPQIEDLPDRDKVYFSWYTFERLYESKAGRDVLEQRMVVATTRENVAFGHTAVGVSVDDREIGHMGADIILRHHAGQTGLTATVDLGTIPVAVPDFRYWIHEGAARQWRRLFGFRCTRTVIRGAAEVFPAPSRDS